MMNRNAWYKKLQKLKGNHNELSASTNIGKPDTLLKQAHALQLLRDINRFLLNNVGKIELLEDASGYDLILVLMWSGTLSEPAVPRSDDNARLHIFVGVRGSSLYVNGKRVASATEKDLQAALLIAAENPGHRRNITEA